MAQPRRPQRIGKYSGTAGLGPTHRLSPGANLRQIVPQAGRRTRLLERCVRRVFGARLDPYHVSQVDGQRSLGDVLVDLAVGEPGQCGVASHDQNLGLRRADANGMATTFYYFDPASEGIASASTTWAESEWQRSRLDADPARKAYVQKLERWGEGWSQIYFKSR